MKHFFNSGSRTWSFICHGWNPGWNPKIDPWKITDPHGTQKMSFFGSEWFPFSQRGLFQVLFVGFQGCRPIRFSTILLVVQKSQTINHLGCIPNPIKSINNGINLNYKNQLVSRISEPSTKITARSGTTISSRRRNWLRPWQRRRRKDAAWSPTGGRRWTYPTDEYPKDPCDWYVYLHGWLIFYGRNRQIC